VCVRHSAVAATNDLIKATNDIIASRSNLRWRRCQSEATCKQGSAKYFPFEIPRSEVKVHLLSPPSHRHISLGSSSSIIISLCKDPRVVGEKILLTPHRHAISSLKNHFLAFPTAHRSSRHIALISTILSSSSRARSHVMKSLASNYGTCAYEASARTEARAVTAITQQSIKPRENSQVGDAVASAACVDTANGNS
jgi:hypothetical protein